MGNLKEIPGLMVQDEDQTQENDTDTGDQDHSLAELESDTFNAYMSLLRRTPLLTSEEEQRLTRLAKQGNEDARRRVLQANLRLVVSVARRYRNRGLEFMDLISEGNTGLIRALDRYDPEKGFRFSTYATWWIREAVLRAIGNDGRLVRLPIHLGTELDRYRRSVAQLERQGNQNPSVEAIARMMNMTAADVHRLSGLNTGVSSLDAPMQEGERLTFVETVTDEAAAGSDAPARARETAAWIDKVLRELPDRQRQILGYRFGLYAREAVTLDEVADMMHLSRERARQLEKEGLKRLRQALVWKGISLRDFY